MQTTLANRCMQSESIPHDCQSGGSRPVTTRISPVLPVDNLTEDKCARSNSLDSRAAKRVLPSFPGFHG